MTSKSAARASGPPKPRTLPFERPAKAAPATNPSTPKDKPAARTTKSSAKGAAPSTQEPVSGKATGKASREGKAPRSPIAKAPSPSRMPDFGPEFAPGSVVRVAYNHPGVGACTYGVRREVDGSFTLTEYEGARTGLVVGKTWKNAWFMLADLVGRPRHNVPLRRWFRLATLNREP